MNGARKSIIEFLKRDLALLRRLGTTEQKAEIGVIEGYLNAIEETPMAVNFAAAKAESEESEDPK